LLSLVTDDANHPSLDIEAPTKLDRDKFARAFAKFLGVPLEGEDGCVEEYQSAASVEISPGHVGGKYYTAFQFGRLYFMLTCSYKFYFPL
jgi:hypothetical protein